jgi:hypothetical protein
VRAGEEVLRRSTLIGLMLALAAVFWPWSVGAQQSPLRIVGHYSFESGRTAFETTLGGLSGLAYDAKRGVYYAVSDDRSENQPARFYTLGIDLNDSGIQDVRVLAVTVIDSDLATPGVQPYERGDSDLEDIQLLPDDTLLVSSERDRANQPWVRHVALDGSLLGELPLPDRYLSLTEPGTDGRPRPVRGIRPNFGFEGMALTPSGETLWLANEQALAQDGPMSSPEGGTNVRIARMERYGAELRASSEYVYAVEPVFATSTNPAVPADNGVSAMLWVRHVLPQYDLLVLERAFAVGAGNDVNIYGVALDDATDVWDVETLPQPFTDRTARKVLLGNLTALGVQPDNLESIVLGPPQANGNPSLLLMSDDNFSGSGSPQVNQFILLEIAAP